MKEFYAEIGDFLADYENGTITISENTDFSMRHTVRQITHYIMSNERNPDGRSDPGSSHLLEWTADSP
jgi:hypothetical protein